LEDFAAKVFKTRTLENATILESGQFSKRKTFLHQSLESEIENFSPSPTKPSAGLDHPDSFFAISSL
jgi:hypothetical protein